ncbi:MAG TPA: VIT1/CCC1 transporter family protein [Candidatus Elarobacter sp.]|nr:VIT1/CCC1 transporter family protein [Candidatus Elarobacter sp.]
MATTVTPPSPSGARHTPDVSAFKHHWQDEADAAYLYDILARLERDERKSDIFRRLSEVESRHVDIWANLIREHGEKLPPFRPSARTRLQAVLGRMFGPGFLLPMLLAEEGREVKGYMDMYRATPHGATGGAEALLLARESAEHATELSQITGTSEEPWHQKESGGFLRNTVYGFNDGLTANFGLVAGVLGASAAAAHHTVIVAGVAGLIADALSMGSSGYLAAKSEQEVYQHEIEMERDEIALMPEIERDELALLYEAKGMNRDTAQQLAAEIMHDPDRMLREQVEQELQIGEPNMSPMREAWLTGTATAIGALIPVLPFFFLKGTLAIVVAFTIAMLSHFLVGAMRSAFTGRGLFRSGFDMFVVGVGVAVVGYYAGEWVGSLLR